MVHSLLAITVPFALFSSYSTPYEFKHALSLTQPTRIFASPSLLPLALTSGFSADRIYLLDGQKGGYTSYDRLVSSVRKNRIPRLPIRHATKDTLAYMIFSSGTSGLPKGMYLFNDLRFPHHRTMNVLLIQCFLLLHPATMLSHGNIASSLLGMMVVGMEIRKVRAVRLCVAVFFI